MKFSVKQQISDLNKSVLMVAVSEKGEFTASGKQLDKQSQGFLRKVIKNDFSGKVGECLVLHHVPHCAAPQILLVGSGKELSVNIRDFRKIVQNGIRALATTSMGKAVSYLMELTVKETDLSAKIKQMVEVIATTQYQFDEFKSVKAPKQALQECVIYIPDRKMLSTAENALKQGMAIVAGMEYTKNLANLPSNICTPSYLADQAKKLAKQYPKISVKVLEEADMRKLGMGAFLSVTKGTQQAAKFICLEYKGTAKKSAPVALVGKGITFDTGGISIKPSEGMVGMKYDMCGAATVLGTLKGVAELKLPIHIVGILAAAENMPSGTASKPEDIVTSLSGQTIEIMNTDAEGRLVLCDALTYCERFKPDAVIDIATLTGAVVIALGYHATGLLSNDEGLAESLLQAGTQSYDRAWQLPLWDEYQDHLKSPFADMSNVGGRAGGTITAACFLSRFAKKFKWAHLDVAGTAAMMGGNDRYATGRPVPLLMQYLINRCS